MYVFIFEVMILSLKYYCFSAFLNIPAAQFKLVLDSIIWAFKHTMRNVADTGLDILYVLLQNVAGEEVAAQSFYQTFFTDILQHIFSIVTDSSHTAGGYKKFAKIFRYIPKFLIFKHNAITPKIFQQLIITSQPLQMHFDLSSRHVWV